MNAWLHNLYLRMSMTFLAVWCYFALHEVGNNIEDPYIPYDPNELALPHYHWSYNAKLLSFIPVPEPDVHETDMHGAWSHTSDDRRSNRAASPGLQPGSLEPAGA